MSFSTGPEAVIADGVVGIFHYHLTDDEGTVLDSTRGEDPMAYLHGRGAMIEGLERALTGRAAGETFTVRVEAADAYGALVDAPEQKVRKNQFPKDFPIEVGQMVPLEGEGGAPLNVWISEIKGAWVTLTRNHPLAGQALNFEVHVVGTRPASADELKHGHAHGLDGSHSHGH